MGPPLTATALSTAHHKPIVLVPALSPERDSVLAALAADGAVAVGPERAAECELAVADLTAPDGLLALAALRQTPAGERLSVVAVAAPARCCPRRSSSTSAPSRPRRGAAPGSHRARARHASSKEERQRQSDLALLLKLTADYAGPSTSRTCSTT